MDQASVTAHADHVARTAGRIDASGAMTGAVINLSCGAVFD
jgi:hypothetical protein